MPKVTPLHVSLEEACQAGQEYLRAYRPQDTSDLEQRRRYREAVDLLKAQIGPNAASISTADARKRRAIFVWIKGHMPDGSGS